MRHYQQIGASLLGLACTFPAWSTTVFINELHYDNAGTDQGEFIEIAGPAGTDLNNWSVVLYNGSSSRRSVYRTEMLSGSISDDTGTGFGFVTITLPSNGIQNGSPDGIALVDSANQVIQFLSYEGSFEAADGPAASLTSVDIGVSETSSTAIGQSLQLTGSGSEYEDYSWSSGAQTVDTANIGQSFNGSDAGGQAEQYEAQRQEQTLCQFKAMLLD